MYATWRSYNIVTNMGTKTEGLWYSQPAWVDYEGKWQWLASPNSGAMNEAFMVTNGGGMTRWFAWKRSAARPALYRLRIIIKGYYDIEIQRVLI